MIEVVDLEIIKVTLGTYRQLRYVIESYDVGQLAAIYNVNNDF